MWCSVGPAVAEDVAVLRLRHRPCAYAPRNIPAIAQRMVTLPTPRLAYAAPGQIPESPQPTPKTAPPTRTFLSKDFRRRS